jgi:hypothetical protein
MRAPRNRSVDEPEPSLEVIDEPAITRSFNTLMRRLESTPHTLSLEDLEDDYSISSFHIDNLTNEEVRRLHSDIIEKYRR